VKLYAAASTGGASSLRANAGDAGTSNYDRVLEGVEYPHVLIAYPYDKAGNYIDGRLRYAPPNVITDSGAFTAWQIGEAIDLRAYRDYCLKLRARLDGISMLHINLDVIPGEKGRWPTDDEKRHGMLASIRNANELRHVGLPIMEVYHHGEPLSFFDQLLERRQPGERIGISPRNDAAHATRRKWLDGVWHHVRERYGSTVPPLHGLGIAGREFVFRYPWSSCDALSWVMPGRFGRRLGRSGTEVHDPQVRVPAMRYHACAGYLRAWRAWEREAGELWTRRGVSWQT
jgi:hypothetical protein